MTERFRGYHLGTASAWSETAKQALVDVIQGGADDARGLLGGRTPIRRAEIPELGAVVVKRYGRGGVFRHFVSERYFCWGKTRSEVEYDILTLVRSLGIAAPEPLVHLHRGWPFYRAWLVTREVAHHTSLAELSRSAEDRARQVLEAFVHQLAVLIDHRILHIDLHPGNVIVDAAGQPYILDFDRAHRFEGRKNALRDRYLHRWRRAVIKHGLPDYLAEYVCLGLRQNFRDDALCTEAR